MLGSRRRGCKTDAGLFETVSDYLPTVPRSAVGMRARG